MGDLVDLIREDRQMDYATWLRKKRKHFGLTQRQLADLTLSRSTISKYEQGLALPDDINRAIIDDAFEELEERLKNA